METDAYGLSTTDLEVFWGAEAPSGDLNWAVLAAGVIQQAEDLLYAVTGLTAAPTDERLARMVRYAIMDMAIMLYVHDPSEAYSPYSSERIGSYSYTLKQNATKGMTGSFWWDLVVSAMLNGDWDAASSLMVTVGEQVFHMGFNIPYRSERLLHASRLASMPGAFELGADPAEGSHWLPGGSTSDGSWAGSPYGQY